MKPTLTIITVTYNCADVIERTLKTILQNKSEQIEYIVIDGESSDGTVELLNQYRDGINTFISEMDKGIYDAMNKGLELANGQYVWFINAGDEIFSTSTITTLLTSMANESPDVLYGDTLLVNDQGEELGLRSEVSSRKLPVDLNWKSLQRGMVVSHQSFIVKRSIAPSYNMKYQSSADIDYVINSLRAATSIKNTGETLSKYLTGGYSKQQHPLSLQERFLILQHHYGVIPNLVNHLIILLRALSFRIRGKALN